VRFPGPTHLVVGFESRAEAERFLNVFRKRLAKFGLELHSEKTRLIEFGRFAALCRQRCGEGKPEKFTFLGFTHHCGRRHNGAFTVWRTTAKKRMVAKPHEIKMELLHRRHEPIPSVGTWLRKVISGYDQYHAVSRQLASTCDLSISAGPVVAACSRAAQPARLDLAGAVAPHPAPMVPPTAYSAPLSSGTLRRHISKVEAACVKCARAALCGGCRVTGIPTAPGRLSGSNSLPAFGTYCTKS
jgi:hypothetical protein